MTDDTWAQLALPEHSYCLTATTSKPEDLITLVDLLYSGLLDDFYQPERMECLGVLDVAKRDSTAFKQAETRLVALNKKSLGLPYDVNANVIDNGQGLFGVIVFYTREEEVTNGATEQTANEP